VTTSKIALKQVFIAFGAALPKQCFVGKNVATHYHVFYNLCFVSWVKHCSSVCSIVKMLQMWLLPDNLR